MDYSVDLIITVIGVFLGSLLTLVITLLVFQWQRIKKEQDLARILINILNAGEIYDFIENINSYKRKYDFKKDEENIKETAYLNFIINIYFLIKPIILSLPDLRTSLEVGTGKVYEIENYMVT